MAVVVLGTIRPLPEHRAEVVAALTEAAPLAHAEDGCQLYALTEAEDRLVMIEQWATQEALDAHNAGPVLAGILPRLKGCLASAPEVVLLTPHPVGDKGTLRP